MEKNIISPRNQGSYHRPGFVSPNLGDSSDAHHYQNEQSLDFISDQILNATSHAVLLKLERKLDIDDILKEFNCEKIDGLFEWLRVLKRIDDERVIRICGTDVALYLVFLRYSSYFFGVISILNLFFLMMYLTGSPQNDDNFRLDHKKAQYAMQALTILNVTASPVKVTICFLYSMIVIPACFFCLLLLYLSKF